MTSRAAPSTTSARPAQLSGRIENPNSAIVSETAPIAPGKTTPGCNTSKTSPTIPTRKRIEIRFGSISVFRKRVKKPGDTVVICAPARCSVKGRCASFVR